jgi:hypothetical protein
MDIPKKDIIARNIPDRDFTDKELIISINQCIQMLSELKSNKNNMMEHIDLPYIISNVLGLTEQIHETANSEE